ncbi:MAG: IPT/TIG domain-containing protein [Vicinamibacterales bacterium]
MTPNSGAPYTLLTIAGTGFKPGALVSLGGISATGVLTYSDSVIRATAPIHDAGAVDVVVTNPGGEGATLTGGFSYSALPPAGTSVTASLSVTPTTVPPGGQLRVSWTKQGQSFFDWIGLFRVGDSNLAYVEYQYTDGGPSGTQTWVAPPQPGQYEFRYLPDDGYVDVARSAPVKVEGTVTSSSAAPQPQTRRGRGSVRR